MEDDVEHFRTKLGKIEGASGVGDKLREVVQAKTIVSTASETDKPEPSSENQEQPKGGSESTES